MNSPIADPTECARILVDLKPAFDGFAGIPQETRLLFGGLRRIQGLEVKGLVQHGGRRLRAGLKIGRDDITADRKIYQLSKLIVSLNERPISNFWDAAGDRIDRYFAFELLRARTALGIAVSSSIFDSRLFSDFIWRTFFDKTLSAKEKDSVCQDDYYVIRSPRNHFHRVGLRSASLSSVARYPMIDTRGFGFFLAQTPFPGRLTPGTQMIVRYHDAVPILMPHTIKDKAFHQATHFNALLSNIKSGAKFACVSEATRTDLLTLFPHIERRTFVVHNMVSEEYYEDDSPRAIVPRLIQNRLADIPLFSKPGTRADKLVGENFQYLLMVSTIEPRKNHRLLVSAWEQLKYTTNPGLKLVIVGNIGWDEDAVLKAFKPWATKGELLYLQNVPSAELRILYRHALLTVCPSLAEGFDYSGVEAMRCGCPVASSRIPVHEEIYGDASAYFNPYSIDEAAECLRRLCSDAGVLERTALTQRGREVSLRYVPGAMLPVWRQLFDKLEMERQVTPASHNLTFGEMSHD
jgi:glycosyltransferase involved in cell wall biosynthesis